MSFLYHSKRMHHSLFLLFFLLSLPAVPVLFGSAILNRGITQLLDAVDLLLPSPLDRPLLSAAPPSPLAASAYLRGIHKRQQSSPITTTTTNNSTALASAASISVSPRSGLLCLPLFLHQYSGELPVSVCFDPSNPCLAICIDSFL